MFDVIVVGAGPAGFNAASHMLHGFLRRDGIAPIGLYFWLTQWNWQPSILGGTMLIVVLYTYAVGPLREKFHLADEVSLGKALAFLLGVNLMFLSLFSALDELGDRYLFSAHMLQHLILSMGGPPLMLLGTPDWLIQPLLRHRVVLRLGKVLTHPAVAFILFNADFWLWHAPPLYDATLFNENLHILEHLSFVIFGLIYWWPMVSPVKEGLPRLSMGGQILYLFFSSMPMVLCRSGADRCAAAVCPLYSCATRLGALSRHGSAAGGPDHVDSRQPFHDRSHEHLVHSLDAAARTQATYRGEQVGHGS